MNMIPLLDLFTAFAAMITKALPDDELQRERFKLRYPKLTQRITQQMLRKAKRDLTRIGATADDKVVIHAYVQLIKMDANFETLLIESLK